MDEVVKTAAAESGWVAALLVAIVLGNISVLGWIVRSLWKDHRALQTYLRTHFVSVIKENTSGFNRLADELEQRPCLRDREERIRQSYVLPDPDAPIARTLRPASLPGQ